MEKIEVIHYPKTGKVGIMGSDAGNLFYRQENTVEYYD